MDIKLTNKMYLGSICCHGHEHKNAGKCLRYIKTNNCVACKKEQSKGWANKNNSRFKELTRTWNYKNKKHHADWKKEYRINKFFKKLIIASRHRAKVKGFDFDIDEKYIEELWQKQKGRCHWLGVKLDTTSRPRSLNKPSIDRIDSKKGYTKENVVISSWFANCGKGSSPIDEFNQFIGELFSCVKERKLYLS